MQCIQEELIVTETFGERLKTLRKEKKLTQQQLADRLDLDQSTISYYEQDKKIPDVKTLDKLAAFFDVTIDSILVRQTTSEEERRNKYIQSMARINRISPTTITADELKEQFKLVVDGKEATDEEIEEAIRYILIQRMMKEKSE
jgi:transcriptional regulator with XRE-family HTH domain